MDEFRQFRIIRMEAAIISFLNKLPSFMLRLRQEGPYQLYEQVNVALDTIEKTRTYIEKALEKDPEPRAREMLRRARKSLHEGIEPFLAALKEHVQDPMWMANEYSPEQELRDEWERRRKPWLQPSKLSIERKPDSSWIPDWLLETIVEDYN